MTMQRIAISQVDDGWKSRIWRNVMSKLKIPAALLVIGAMSLGVPAIAAPVASLSAAAKPMAQESDLVQVRFGWYGWHGGRRYYHYRCYPYCGWGG
jgi:hypothetical protein